jgi:hypothetical protein
VTTRLPRRSLIVMLALALSMATLVVLLTLSPQAMARARSGACPSSLTAHPKAGAHACAPAKRASRPARTGKAHAHAKVTGHHSKHPKKGKRKTKAAGKRAKSPAHSTTPAVCENGSAPVNEGGGSFSCADESEPMCGNGSTPELSSNGAALACPVKASGAGLTEAVCEDGSAPVRAGDGSFSCDDESQPVCEDGAVPASSSSGMTLVCGAESGAGSAAAEVGCEDGSIAVQASDGSYSCAGSSEPGCGSTSVPTLSSEHWTSVCDVAPEGGS